MYQKAYDLLPWEDRKEKIRRYRQEGDRLRGLAAGVMAADLLRQKGARDLTMTYGPYGKPCLKEYPEIHFNLSHTGTMAVCVISDHPVGVDVEKTRPYVEKTGKRCFNKDQLAWIGQVKDRDREWIRLWTRKESRLKLDGTGLWGPIASIPVLPGEDQGCFYCETELGEYHICVCSLQEKRAFFRLYDEKNRSKCNKS